MIKSRLGQPIAAFSGDDVYWEVPEDLPKMTKLMIDGKALYIHRANYYIRNFTDKLIACFGKFFYNKFRCNKIIFRDNEK